MSGVADVDCLLICSFCFLHAQVLESFGDLVTREMCFLRLNPVAWFLYTNGLTPIEFPKAIPLEVFAYFSLSVDFLFKRFNHLLIFNCQ